MEYKTIKLSNLPEGIVDSDIYVFLQTIEKEIEFVNIFAEGKAFVCFYHAEDVENAMLFDGSTIADREINIEKAERNDPDFQ